MRLRAVSLGHGRNSLESGRQSKALSTLPIVWPDALAHSIATRLRTLNTRGSPDPSTGSGNSAPITARSWTIRIGQAQTRALNQTKSCVMKNHGCYKKHWLNMRPALLRRDRLSAEPERGD